MPTADETFIQKHVKVEDFIDHDEARDLMWEVIADLFKSDSPKTMFNRAPQLGLGSFYRAMFHGPGPDTYRRITMMRKVLEEGRSPKSSQLLMTGAQRRNLERDFRRRDAETWSPRLATIAGMIRSQVGWMPDAVSVNIFRDGRDCMAFHLDSPDMFLRFATVSLGACRELAFRNINQATGAGAKVASIPMPSGSLTLMEDRELLARYQHGVPPEYDVEGIPYAFHSNPDFFEQGTRMSLTFYELFDEDDIKPMHESHVVFGELYDKVFIPRFSADSLEEILAHLVCFKSGGFAPAMDLGNPTYVVNIPLWAWNAQSFRIDQLIQDVEEALNDAED